jgi:replication factor C subunit 1
MSQESLLWVEKYKPKGLNQIIGNVQNVQFIQRWLQNWSSELNQEILDKQKLAKENERNETNKRFKSTRIKSLLVAGSPGIGKTSSVELIGKLLGFNVVELNASDTRNKAQLHNSAQQVAQYPSLDRFFNKFKVIPQESKSKPIPTTPKAVENRYNLLICDECDGVAGQEDKGGLQELIRIIDETEHPIICICNDIQSRKIKTLKSHCHVLKWFPPSVDQILPSLMGIVKQEQLLFTILQVKSFIVQSQCDIRQSINLLQLQSYSNRTHNNSATTKPSQSSHLKDVQILDSFQSVSNMFVVPLPKNATEQKQAVSTTPKSQDCVVSNSKRSQSLLKKLDEMKKYKQSGDKQSYDAEEGEGKNYIDAVSKFYYEDSFKIPLFVQENVVLMEPSQSLSKKTDEMKNSSLREITILSETLDSISTGDHVSEKIHTKQDWELMPVEAFFSCVIPAFTHQQTSKHAFRVEFPQSLGKWKSMTKNQRILKELESQSALLCGQQSNSLDFIQSLHLIHADLFEPLQRNPPNVAECLRRLDKWNLTKENWESLQELISHSFAGIAAPKQISTELDTKTKTALTKAYKSSAHKMQFSKSNVKLKKKRQNENSNNGENDENESEEEDEDDDETDSKQDDAIIGVKQGKTTELKTATKSKAKRTKT